MKELTLPPFEYDVRIYEGERQIYDTLRRKYVKITPEEWVRQHVVHYLIDSKGYSPHLMAIERSFEVNGMTRRFDLACFDRSGEIYLLVECKNSDVELTQEVFDQAFCYNTRLDAKFVAVTNGRSILTLRSSDLAPSASLSASPQIPILSDFPPSPSL